MRGTRLLLIFSVLMSCSGCVVVSLHPLSSPEVYAEDQSLEGAWVEFDRILEREETSWIVTAQRSGYEIQILADRPEMAETYLARLARIGKHLYLDIQPKPSPSPAALTSIATHQFLRLSKGKDHLRIEALDRKKLEAVIKKAGDPISGEDVDIRLVLTSKTPTLQAFFKEHGDKVFGQPTILRRKPVVEQAPEVKVSAVPPNPALQRTRPAAMPSGQSEVTVGGPVR